MAIFISALKAAGFLLVSWIIYALFVRHHFSRYRHLPQAAQPSLLKRLFHEPTTFELTKWIRETPNEGYIRFFGFLNQERLLMTHPDILKQVLLKDSYKFDKLPSLAALQSPARVSGLVTAKGFLHQHHRRRTIGAYNSAVARNLYPSIWAPVQSFTSELKKRTAESRPRPVLINKFMQSACLDIVGRAGFGLKLDAVSRPEDSRVKKYMKLFKVIEDAPLFLKLLQICPVPLQFPAVNLITPFLRLDITSMISSVQQTVETKVNNAKELKGGALGRPSGGTDVISEIITRAYEHMSTKALMRHAMTTMAGSVEMVSNELSWAIYALSKHPHVQDKLRTAIRTTFPSPPAKVTPEDINKIPYLGATCNEIFRLFPGVPHRWRICNTHTSVLGMEIAKGTNLVWAINAMNRDPGFWGSDSDQFRPERWLEQRQNHPGAEYYFLTFGQGMRKCVGEQYTRAVVACMLLNLVGHFRFSMDGCTDVLSDGGSKIGFGIVMKGMISAHVDVVPGWE